MAQIIPFRGITFNKRMIDDISSVVSPPYDVISPSLQESLYQRSLWNVVRLILGKQYPTDNEEDNRYTRAARFWYEWRTKGILSQDENPAIYVISEEYSLAGENKNRLGFLALMKLEEFSTGKIRPHEKTLAKPKADRLQLMRSCRANFSPVFSLYEDSKGVQDLFSDCIQGSPDTHVDDTEGIVYRMWRLTSSSIIKQICDAMIDNEVFIADGHHRYETALTFRNEMRSAVPGTDENAPYDYMMIYFADSKQPGLSILPTHRLLRNIPLFDTEEFLDSASRFFDIVPFQGKPADLLIRMKTLGERKHVFGFYSGAKSFKILSLKDQSLLEDFTFDSTTWKKLDVAIAQKVLLEHLLKIDPASFESREQAIYTVDEANAVDMVDSRQCQLAVFLNPTRIEQVQYVAEHGDVMPQKSTYFYPKLLTGLVMNTLE